MARLSKDKRDRLILVIIGTIAACTGLWFGVIKTRQGQLKESKVRLAAAIDKLEKARTRVKQGSKVEADMETVTKRLKSIEETMATAADLYSWAYLLLEKARAGHDVNIIDVTRPAKGDVGMLAQFPYDAAVFSVRGSAYYHQFGKFLADFENSFPHFRVQNLTLGAMDSLAGSDAVSVRSGEERLQFKIDIVALIKPNQ